MKKIINIKGETLAASILLIINIGFVIFSLKSNPFSHVLNGHDSSMFLYFGNGMQNGLAPYSDMFDHKGIVLFWIQHLGVLIGQGNFSLGIWVLEILFYGIAVVFLVKSVLLLTKNFLAASMSVVLFTGGIISSFAGGNLSEQYAITFISIALYLFLKICIKEKNNKIDLLLIGIMGGLTFFIRSNMVALWLVFCLYLLIKGLVSKNYLVLSKQVLYIFIGGVSVCLVVLLYGIYVGNLTDMIYQTFTLNLKYSSGTSSGERLLAGKAFFEFASTVGIVSFVVLSLYYIINNTEKLKGNIYKTSLILIVYVIVNFITVILSGRFYLHYFTTMFPGIIVLTAIGIDGVNSSIKGNGRKLLIMATLFLIPISFFSKTYNEMAKPILNTMPNERIDSYKVSSANFIKEHSSEKDTIYVHNIDANIYLLSERFSNSRFFVLPDIDYRTFNNLRQEFKDALENNPPKFVVIRKAIYLNQENLTDARLDKTITENLNKYYEIALEFESDGILIFSRK